jgi:hypothetical protein
MNDVRVIQGIERDSGALERAEGVDRVAHDDVNAPFRKDVRYLPRVACA